LDTFAKQWGAAILGEYREVETGKRKDRPELAKAKALAPPFLLTSFPPRPLAVRPPGLHKPAGPRDAPAPYE